MDQTRPWKTDAELEAQMRQGPSGFAGFGRGGGVVVAREKPRRPWGTYGLLLTFLALYILELVVFYTSPQATFRDVFTIYSIVNDYDWIYRPWSPILSTLSHAPTRPGHLILNGLVLFFFGPQIEFRLGRNRFLAFFFATGALSGVVQAIISPVPALGASGAIMGLIGLTIMLEPNARILMFPFPTPIPLWVAGIIFALIDLAGATSGHTGIGNFAHLSGMAIGLAYGWVHKRPRRPKSELFRP